MDKPNLRNDYESFHKFLNGYCEKLNEKCEDIETVPIRQPNPRIRQDELEGEVLEWCLNFLSTRGCPQVLSAQLAHETFLRVSKSDLEHYLTDDSRNSNRRQQENRDGSGGKEKQEDQKSEEETVLEYSAEKLHSFVTSTLEAACKSWQSSLPDLSLPNRILEVSYHAIKNTRRKMEDSHTIIPDLNSLYGLQDRPSQSFYGVFDGHAGTEAALFASKHFHGYLARKCSSEKDTGRALTSSFKATDEHFIVKAKRERWKSGSTGVTALVCGNQLHMAWLGDSQALLVRDGKPATHMEPHKPEKQEERDRIEAEGGFTMLVGDCWRVGGNIAVSRAIGDAAYKPFISSEAELITEDLDGTEDYMVLACDGLWDVVTEEELPRLVYNYVESGGDRSSVAKYLVQYAKDNDSMDNISVIVVFFRENISEPSGDTGMFNFCIGDSQGANNSEDSASGKGDHSHSQDGKGGNSDSSNLKGNNPGKSENPSDALDDSEMYVNNDDYSEMYEAYDDIKENSPRFQDDAQMYNNDVTDTEIPNNDDLDYYGVFNTRLVDGPIDLSFMDDPNSSLLLKDIADSVYGRRFGEDAEVMKYFDTQGIGRVPYNGKMAKENARIPEQDNQTSRKAKPRPHHHQPATKKYNTKGLASSPMCWAFTGCNKATVKNHKLNLAARGLSKATHLVGAPANFDIKRSKFALLNLSDNNVQQSNVKPGGMPMPHGKLDSLPPSKTKGLQQPTNSLNQPSNFTVFGSKSKIKPESQKFHTSWRPRKPLKPISSIVYETPPTPFNLQKVSNPKGH